MATFKVITFLCILLSIPVAHSYSSGAGGCPGGVAAVQGSGHTISATTGSLATGGFQVTLDSTPLTPGTAADFVIGQDHVLMVKVTTATFFKGVLFRLGAAGGVATTAALSVQSGDTSLRLAAETCISGGAGGVTHANPSQKTVASTTLRLNSLASNLPLDVTVVVQLNGGSQYYYSAFALNAVSGVTNPPTLAPVVPATPPPTNRPSPLPVTNPPTLAPVVSPTLPPTSRPSPLPVASTTSAPVQPQVAPVAPPTSPPVVASTARPVSPTLKPVAPTRAPFAQSPTTPVRPVSRPSKTRRPVTHRRRPTRQPTHWPTSSPDVSPSSNDDSDDSGQNWN